jgi:hypothetical protein
LDEYLKLFNEFIEIKDTMTEVKDSMPPTIGLVKILLEGSIDMHVSID